MNYKWKPSKSQRREFAIRMQDVNERNAYEKRKEDRLQKRRSTSSFDYTIAGGYYIPTKEQYDFALNNTQLFQTTEKQNAMNQVIYGYSCQEKIHHDYIHIVNEERRNLQLNY